MKQKSLGEQERSEIPSDFDRYSDYKSTNIEWLGDIPEHWGLNIVDQIAELKPGYSFDSDNFSKESGFPLIRIRNIREKSINHYYDGEITPEMKEVIVEKGDIIIGMDGDFNVFWWDDEDALLNQRMTRITTNNYYARRYLYYVLPLALDYIQDITASTTVKHLSTNEIRKIKIPKVSNNEKEAIVEFLDQETGKIDELIQKKEKLIELLEEKRETMIKQAVSNGINPDAGMKDSNVEWLGEIPENWEVRQLRYLGDIDTGDKDTKDKVDDGEYPFFVRSQTEERIDSYSYDGEAVLTAGDGVGVGKVFHYIDGKFDYHQRVYKISNFDEEIDGKFFFYYLKANLKMEIFKNNAKSTVDSLRMPMFKSFPVAFGSLEQQREIVEYLEKQNKEIDNLIEQVEEGIERLKEYRKALITEAVTGQIDVRGEV